MTEERKATARELMTVLPQLMRPVKAELIRRQQRDNLTFPQLLLLRELSSGDYTVSELARRIQVQPPTVTQMMNLLVQRGWVERYDDPRDRRIVRSRLTPAGRQHYDEIDAAALERVVALLGRLSPAELQTVRQACAILAPLVEPLAHGCLERTEAATEGDSARTSDPHVGALV